MTDVALLTDHHPGAIFAHGSKLASGNMCSKFQDPQALTTYTSFEVSIDAGYTLAARDFEASILLKPLRCRYALLNERLKTPGSESVTSPNRPGKER